MNQELTLLERWNAPTPKFFQLALKAGAIVAVVAAVLTGCHDALVEQGFPVPLLLAKVIEGVGYVAAGIAFISKFAIGRES